MSQPPQGNEPLQNQVIQPVANQPVPMYMNPAERVGINNLINEFRRNYEGNFAPMTAELQNLQNLEAAMYWICHEVDTLQRQGHNLSNILATDQLMTRIACSAALSAQRYRRNNPRARRSSCLSSQVPQKGLASLP